MYKLEDFKIEEIVSGKFKFADGTESDVTYWFKDPFPIYMTYEKFKESKKEPKYFGIKCFVSMCDKPAEYEGGDARFYCGMCEEHAMIKEQYGWYKDRING